MAAENGVSASLAEDGQEPGAALRDAVDRQRSADTPDLFAEDLAQEMAEIASPGGLTLPGRRPGRPKGSRNRSTEDTKRLIRVMGGDPQMAAARRIAAGPLGLIREAQAVYAEAYGGEIDDQGRVLQVTEILDDEGNITGYLRSVREVLPVSDAMTKFQRFIDFLGPYIMPKEAQAVTLDVEGLSVRIHAGGSGNGAPPDIGGDEAGSRRRYALPDDDGAEPANSITYDDGADGGHLPEGSHE